MQYDDYGGRAARDEWFPADAAGWFNQPAAASAERRIGPDGGLYAERRFVFLFGAAAWDTALAVPAAKKKKGGKAGDPRLRLMLQYERYLEPVFDNP
eukprot:gene46400-60634_t